MLLRELTRQHGPLTFHQSGGCCDGGAPMCSAAGMVILRSRMLDDELAALRSG